MARTFQKCWAHEIRRVRRAFFADAGVHFGRALTDADLDALDQLDDIEAVATALPSLTPTEQTEVLWALRLTVRAIASTP
jgi:hypothetical protein